MTRTLTFALLLAIAACGGKDKGGSGTTPPAGGAGDHRDGDHHADGEQMHDELSPEMKTFHDVLAPLWHADKGAKRSADTCAAVPQLKTNADGIATATPPVSTNADTWTTGTRALVAAIGELETACKGKADIEAPFAKVHDAFHNLMKQAKAAGGGDRTGIGAGKGPGHEHKPAAETGTGSAAPPAHGGHDHHH